MTDSDELQNDESDSILAEDILNYYVGYLRLVYMVHQNSHWKCNGSNFYGNHTLFQRIYEDAQDRTDQAAEKLIGLFGNAALKTDEHTLLIAKNISKYDSEDPIQNSLDVEKDFQKVSNEVYSNIKEKTDELTLGLDDMIMSIHSASETAVYLLKQAAKSE